MRIGARCESDLLIVDAPGWWVAKIGTRKILKMQRAIYNGVAIPAQPQALPARAFECLRGKRETCPADMTIE
jgi:hypothetical protein